MATRSALVLAIDIGTSSVRSGLFNEKAQLIAGSKASQAYRVHHSLDQAAELDPAVLLRASRKCLRLTKSCLTKRQVPVVAGSGFWHSLLGLDRNGNPLTPIYTWADARSAPDAARLRDRCDERAIQQRTGCMLRASFWPAKLAWLRRTQPRLLRRVARWASPAEWVFEKIFGFQGCSHSMASATGLYHLARRDWDEELLDFVGLRRGQVGSLGDKAEVKGKTFFPAIGDGAAGNLGSGATRPGLVAINLGTSAAIRALTPEEVVLPFGLFRFLIDQRRSLIGGAVSNAGNLRAWALRELRLPNDADMLEKLLRRAGPGAARLTVLPLWLAERAPTWPEGLEGVIAGLTQVTTAADLLAALVASSFHRLADVLHELEQTAGRAKKLVVSGGILQSPASLQLLADSLGRSLVICQEQEASLRGAAVHAIEQLGGKVAPAKIRRQIHHRPARTAELREQAARQRELERTLARLIR